MGSRPTWMALALLGALALPTAWLARERASLTVDAENHSLKSVGTDEALAQARRIEGFGHDPTVVLLFRALPLSSGSMQATDEAVIEALAGRLEGQDGVAQVRHLPAKSHGARALSVRLGSEGEGSWQGALERVVQLAREATPPTLRLALTGRPLAELAISAAVRADQARVVPMVVLGLALLLLLVYRRPTAVGAILIPPGLGILWTGGLYSLCGHRLDPVAVLLDPVLLTVGVAGGVHLAERYLSDRALGHDRWSAARDAIADLWLPTTLTSFTTVVGFLSLAPHPIPAVADFGVFAALGVSLTALLVLVLTPTLLALGDRGVDTRALTRRLALWDTIGARLSGWVVHRAGAVRWCAALLALLGALAWARIEVDNDPLRILPADHPLRLDTGLVARELGGCETFDVLVPATSPLAEPTRLALLATDLFERTGVAGPLGPALRSASGDLLVSALLEPGGSRAREELFDAVELRAQSFGADGVRLAGTSVQVARDSARLIRGQMRGLGLTLAALFAVFSAAFRSLRTGLLAMAPNVLPCLAVYGGMALVGRPVSVASAMISSVLLGLIVDDTIHLLHRYRQARARGLTPPAAVERALDHAGRAVVVTSLVLAGGFATSLAGELETSREFGMLAAVTILVALVADLVLLPALLVGRERPAVPSRA